MAQKPGPATGLGFEVLLIIERPFSTALADRKWNV